VKIIVGGPGSEVNGALVPADYQPILGHCLKNDAGTNEKGHEEQD
jgi:hypothetical protein